MLSTEVIFFVPPRRKGLSQHTVDNEVSALVRLSFYENLRGDWARNKFPLSALTGVSGLNLEKM